MKELLKKDYVKYLLGVFIFTLIFSIITPLTGDDWGNYLVGRGGLKASIDSAINMYQVWEGRFISRIFLNYLSYNKFIWNILNAFQITTIIYCAYKIINVKEKKYIYILPILGILLVNYDFFTQNYLWLAGNMTYLTPTVLIFIIFTYLYKKDNYKLKPLIYIIFFILSIMIPMFVENIGCAYIFGLLLWIIYVFYKEKRISIQLVSMLIVSSISLIIMLKSPGSLARMQLTEEFNKLNIFEKVFTNIPNFIFYVFTKNIFVLGFMLIPINLMLNKVIKSKHKKLIMIIFNIIPVLSIIENIRYMIPANFENTIPLYKGMFLTSNWYFVIYWLLFGCFFIYSVIYFVKNKDEMFKTLIILLSSISSVLAMLISPTWGDRVTVFVTLVLIFVSIKIINDHIDIKDKINKYIKLFFIITVICYVLVGTYNFVFELRRQQHIKYALDNNFETIILYQNRNTLLWNYHPWEGYHQLTYKKCYGIDENIKVEVVTPSIKELIKFIIKGEFRR